MARSIKGLLRKTSWTGEEAGRVLIACLVSVMRKKDKAYKLPFSSAELTEMQRGFDSQFDYDVYGVFCDIYNSMRDGFYRGLQSTLQLYSSLDKYSSILERVQNADKALIAAERHPIIMTKSQYIRIVEMTLLEKRSTKISYRAIVFDLLRYYLKNFDDSAEEIPTEIRVALKKIESAPVKNKRILENFNDDTDEGYYALPDGRRSDRMSSEAWFKASSEEDDNQIMDGEDAGSRENFTAKNLRSLFKGCRLLFEGPEAIHKAAREIGVVLPEDMTEERLLEIVDALVNGNEYDLEGDWENIVPVQRILNGDNETTGTV